MHHEFGLARQVIDVVNATLIQHPGSRARRIEVALGEHAGIQADALRFSFEMASEGTDAAGAELAIRDVPLTVRCRDCGAGPQAVEELACPACGSSSVTVTAGCDLEVVAVEIAPGNEMRP